MWTRKCFGGNHIIAFKSFACIRLGLDLIDFVGASKRLSLLGPWTGPLFFDRTPTANLEDGRRDGMIFNLQDRAGVHKWNRSLGLVNDWSRNIYDKEVSSFDFKSVSSCGQLLLNGSLLKVLRVKQQDLASSRTLKVGKAGGKSLTPHRVFKSTEALHGQKKNYGNTVTKITADAGKSIKICDDKYIKMKK